MLQFITQKGPWFRAKTYGYGAGWPMRWQGWAIMLLYILLVVGAGQFAEADQGANRIIAYLVIALATLLFILICRARTQGGWKWRWGDKGSGPAGD